MPNRVIDNGRVPHLVGKDKRLKLTAEQRQEIRENVDKLSHQKLAAKYGVSKRLVQFILNPEKHRDNLVKREERGGWERYYVKEKHTAAMAVHRQHKKELHQRGELIV